MNALIIKQLDEQLLNDAANFISVQQKNDSQYVAWLGYSTDEIKQQLLDLKPSYKENCLVAISNNTIYGFLGAYRSEEQSVIRLLGPYVDSEISFLELSKQLVAQMMDSIGKPYKLVKTAFYEANTNCGLLFEANGFELYNAEKTLILEKLDLLNLVIPFDDQVIFAHYEQSDFDSFASLHPTNAYYSASEVVERLSSDNQLVLAKINEVAIGYVYFELLKSDQIAEICFLNVNSGYRSRGLGSMLIGKAVHESFNNEWINAIQISVRVENKKAENLYTRVGFKEKNTIFAYQRDLENDPWENIR